MLVCANCKKEMTCKKNGSNICFNKGTHVYSADQYECPICGSLVNVSSSNSPFYNPNPESSPYDVRMD